MLKMLPPGMTPGNYASTPQGQQGTQQAMEWAKQKGVVLPGMTMPPPPPAKPPRPRLGAAANPGDQYAIQTLMQMYDVPQGFSPDPEAQANCPPSRPYCNPVFVDQIGRRWTPGQPNPGPPPHSKPSNPPVNMSDPAWRAEQQRKKAMNAKPAGQPQ